MISQVMHITHDDVVSRLPLPAPNANKYTRGKLVLVSGCAAYPGAAALASMAAQVSGAGYVQTYVEDSIQNVVRLLADPSLVVYPWSAWDVHAAAPFSAHHPCAYAVGSGFDAADEICQKLALDAVYFLHAPLIVDGGALGALATQAGIKMCAARKDAGQATVITPHGGEAARLAHAANIQADGPALLSQKLSQAYGCVCVLKGPDTYISDGSHVAVMTKGTAALAKAGTGDVLAGIVGSFLAQGICAWDAAVIATSVHAQAGIYAARQKSDISVRPEDVIQCLPNVFVDLEKERVHHEQKN